MANTFNIGDEYTLTRAWEQFDAKDRIKLVEYDWYEGLYMWKVILPSKKWSNYKFRTKTLPPDDAHDGHAEEAVKPLIGGDIYAAGPEGETKGYMDMATGLRWL